MSTLGRTLTCSADATITDQRDDTELLQAVALHRDRAAFEELFFRYQHQAYSFACHFVQNSALAEEAVQEAMLAIWVAPRTELHGRSVREWILGTVAGKSLNLRRKQQKILRREKSIPLECHSAAIPFAENEEVSQLLRRSMAALPECDSQLLALAYVANLTHQKIADLLGIPRRTVSRKLESTLEQLKLSLKRAGVAAVLPMLTAKSIGHALTSRNTCPVELGEQLAHVFEKSSVASRRTKRIRRPLNATPAVGLWLIGITAIVAACIAFCCDGLSRSTPPAQLPTSAPPLAQVAPKPVSLPEAVPVPSPIKVATSPAQADTTFNYKCWNFKDGPAPELKLILGNWEWHRSGQTGVMRTVGDEPIALALPLSVSKKPFKITLKAHSSPSHDNVSRVRPMWLNQHGTLPFESWYKATAETQATEITEAWFVGNCVYQLYGTTPNAFEKYETEYPATAICIVLKSVEIKEISIRSLTPEEIPPVLRDGNEFLRKLNAMGCSYEPPNPANSNTAVKSNRTN